MNKKSIILSFLLCIGLLTPHTTKSAFALIPLSIGSVVYTSNKIYNNNNPSAASHFLKKQEHIRCYNAFITVQDTKTGTLFFNKKYISKLDPHACIENIKKLVKPYEKQKNIKLRIESSITLISYETVKLTPITKKNFTLSALEKNLKSRMLVQGDSIFTLTTPKAILLALGTWITTSIFAPDSSWFMFLAW